MAATRLAALLVAAGLCAAACQGERPSPFRLREPFAPPTDSPTLTVGFVGTLSGPNAWRGEDAFEGADLGVHHLNRSRPPGTRSFELVQLDDGGDAGRAAELVERLARLDTTVGIVYAGPPEGLVTAAPALTRAGIPALLCYGDPGEGDRSHLFAVSPPVAVQARRIAAYLAGDRGYETVGALAERSPAGAAAVEALRDAAGGRVEVAAARYSSSGSRLRPPLRRLRRRAAEAVVVHGGPGLVGRTLATLADMGASYRSTARARIASAPAPVARRRRAQRIWHPQVAAFDLAVSPRLDDPPPGTVASESYGRGVHFLPIRSLERFRRAFHGWWNMEPSGWQQRAYEAVRAIGWAATSGAPAADLAGVLEGLRGRRFGGLTIAFGREDHVATPAGAVGLWVVPRPGAARGAGGGSRFPWVPLARTFAGSAGRTRVARRDWSALFGPAGPGRRPPPYRAMLVGVTTGPADPVH